MLGEGGESQKRESLYVVVFIVVFQEGNLHTTYASDPKFMTFCAWVQG